MSDTTFDFARPARIGIAEAVLCPGKTAAQIEGVIASCRARATPLLLTRLSADLLASLSPAARAGLDHDDASRTAILGPWQAPTGAPRVAVVTAGTSDLPVAREALRTLAFHGVAAAEVADVGVAGLWRLLARADDLQRYPVVIAVAGMEGALFSVLGGLVGGLVIAVPTSTGYGVASGGRTALGSALASCAPGVVAVNVDNGYGAACAALRALRTTLADAPADDATGKAADPAPPGQG